MARKELFNATFFHSFFFPFPYFLSFYLSFLIADSDSSAIQVESSKGDREEEEENFYTSFLVGLVRGLSDDARLKGPTRGGGGLGDHPPGVPRGRLPYLTRRGGFLGSLG